MYIVLIKTASFYKNCFVTSSRIFVLSFSSKDQIFQSEEGIKLVKHMKLMTIF